MLEESRNEPWIINLRDVDDAKDLALQINPNSIAYKEMYKINEGNEPWICVLGRCDICSYKEIFFAPAIIYQDDIAGVECGDCGNMSVYPQERNNDEK